jgi:hypothetical protein
VADADRAEIEEAVGKELAARGVQGTVVLAGATLELRAAGGGAPVSIQVEMILGQWPLLPEEMRRRKAGEMAGRLVASLEAARRAEGREAPRSAADAKARGRILGAVIGLVGLLVVIGAVRFAIPRLFVAEEKVQPAVPAEAEAARAERLARACDASRERLYKGSAFGPFALEGWAVELWLARRDGGAIREHPALTALAPGGKLTAAASAELAQVRDGRVELADGLTGEAAQRSPGWAAVAVVFRDGYGRAFFEEERRVAFLALADRLVEATGADHAALYARCAHLPTHDVGAWFHGPDAAGAAAVLVYQMGAFAETRVIDRGALAALHAPGDLDALRKAAGTLQSGGAGAGDGVAKLLSAQGGSVRTAGGSTLVFPLTAPLRPLTAAKELARRMGVASPSAD